MLKLYRGTAIDFVGRSKNPNETKIYQTSFV